MISKFLDKPRKPEREEEAPVSVRCPATDIYETNDAFVFLLDMPAADSGKLELNYGNQELSVDAPLATDPSVFYRRRFVLPGILRSTESTANYRNGVLEIRLKKVRPTVQKLKVEVQT